MTGILSVYAVAEPRSLEFPVGNGAGSTDVSIVIIPEGPLDIRKVVVPVVVSVVGTGKANVEVSFTVGANVLVAAVLAAADTAVPVPSVTVVLGKGNGTGDSVMLCVGAVPGKTELGEDVLAPKEVFPAPVLNTPVTFTPVERVTVDIGPGPVPVTPVAPTDPVPNI